MPQTQQRKAAKSVNVMYKNEKTKSFPENVSFQTFHSISQFTSSLIHLQPICCSINL